MYYILIFQPESVTEYKQDLRIWLAARAPPVYLS